MPERARRDEPRLEAIREALATEAREYSGKVLLVPGAGQLARAARRSPAYLYGLGTNYEVRVAEATGLRVIQKGGIVLAGEVSEAVRAAFDKASIRAAAEGLPPEQIAILIGHLAQKLAAS